MTVDHLSKQDINAESIQEALDIRNFKFFFEISIQEEKTFKSERNEFEISIRTVLKVIPAEDVKNIFMMNSFSSHP